MKSVEKVLLAQREDGKFRRLHRSRHTTNFDFVEEPEHAEWIKPHKVEHLESPQPAPYYFENSHRAREYWLRGCVMVAFEITTEVNAVALV